MSIDSRDMILLCQISKQHSNNLEGMLPDLEAIVTLEQDSEAKDRFPQDPEPTLTGTPKDSICQT